MYALEPFADVLAEAADLIVDNFNDMRLSESQSIQLDAKTYSQLDAVGAIRVFTARIDGRIVGYRSFVLMKHQHTGEKVAKCDTFYVEHDHRARVAVGLQSFSDRKLREEGVVWVHQAHNPEKHDLSRFLVARHYRPIETTFARKLN